MRCVTLPFDTTAGGFAPYQGAVGVSKTVPDPPFATDFIALSILDHYRRLFASEVPTNFHLRSVVSRFQQLGEFIMPASRKSAVTGRGQFDVTFINIRLDKQGEKQFTEWYSRDQRELAEELAVFVSKGHKLGLSWDDKNTCFTASATCRDDRSPNFNSCITSRSDDFFEAMMMNVFKAEVLFEGGTWVADDRGSNWG